MFNTKYMFHPNSNKIFKPEFTIYVFELHMKYTYILDWMHLIETNYSALH